MTIEFDTADKRLPVTILSGFLGSGKTTMLQNILKSKDTSLKCAVIVNDMGAINIDANLIKRSQVIQQEEKLLEMQNGCICCTLRVDLLEEIANLAARGNINYLIIESSGISEPMQVAETFSYEFSTAMSDEIEDLGFDENAAVPEGVKKILLEGGLTKVSRLDTCVTVVDAFNFFANFNTADFLSDRYQDVDAQDERNITDLMIDQIEFSNVIVVNKCDMVTKDTCNRIERVIQKLNPTAKVLMTTQAKIDLKEILNTKMFDFEQASLGAGWLRSLFELTTREVNGKMKKVPKPETEEYGVSSCVFRSRKPFHPKRLFEMISEKFVLIQDSYEEEDEEDDEDEEDKDKNEKDKKEKEKTEKEEDSKEADWNDCDEELSPEEEKKRHAQKIENKAKDPVFKGLLRSKGTLWLATRNSVMGEWSQAGGILTIKGGPTWYCEQDESDLPDDPALLKSIFQDFKGEWGDRRQEIVLIGENLKSGAVQAAFEAALLTDKEMKKWTKIMRNKKLDEDERDEKLFETFEDGWEMWPIMDEGDNEDDDDDDDDEDEDEDEKEEEKKEKSEVKKKAKK